MNYISTKDAARKYLKSISTIKRVVAKTPEQHLKYDPSREAKNYRVFIEVAYLDKLYSSSNDTHFTPPSDAANDTVLMLQKELERKQEVINELLLTNKLHLEQRKEDTQRQKELIENNNRLIQNETNFQVLLERSNQRADLLETHFNRNRKINPSAEDEVIEDIIEEAKEDVNDIVEEPTNVNSIDDFNSWLKSMSKPH